jgi:DMSO/TMAO reductase YedYZ molybdopterin-dependent catalytic subunit
MNQRPRLPPNQQLVAAHKWPFIGERAPAHLESPWSLTVSAAGSSHTWSIDELRQLPQTELTIDIHCVTRWSKYDVPISGVLLEDLLLDLPFEIEKVNPKFISFKSRSSRNHSSSLLIREAINHECLITLNAYGAPLETDHGGPIRNIVPGKYFYKSVKWLEKIDLLAEDELGYWEAETGYHNGADPWKEERYMSPTIDRREAAQLLQSKDFSDRDLRSIDASGRNLDNLIAKSALLRDANFDDCSLVNANFDQANLSNAKFRNANLQDASFDGTDVEGANFAGANLDGVSLIGSSLIGASFCLVDKSENVTSPANITATTVIDEDQMATLSEFQFEFLQRCFRRN